MKKYQSGFTLIELMIVIAIIGILASIAVPQYGQYTRKAKITDALSITHEAKTALIQYHAINGQFVENYGDLSKRNEEIGLQTRESYASANVKLLWVGSRGVKGADETSAHIAVMLPADMGFQSSGGYARLLSTIELKDGQYIFVCNDVNSVWPSNIKPEYLPKACQQK